MQFRFVLGLVGVYRAEVLFRFHLVAAFHRCVFKVGINGEILAVADDDDGVGASQFGDTSHFALKDGTGLGTFGGDDVDAVVGHGNFVRHDGSVFAVR